MKPNLHKYTGVTQQVISDHVDSDSDDLLFSSGSNHSDDDFYPDDDMMAGSNSIQNAHKVPAVRQSLLRNNHTGNGNGNTSHGNRSQNTTFGGSKKPKGRKKKAKEMMKELDWVQDVEEISQEQLQAWASAKKRNGSQQQTTRNSLANPDHPHGTNNASGTNWEHDILVSTGYSDQSSKETRRKWMIACIVLSVYIILLVAVIALLSSNTNGVLSRYVVTAGEVSRPGWWQVALNTSGIVGQMNGQMTSLNKEGTEWAWLFGKTSSATTTIGNSLLRIQLDKNQTVSSANYLEAKDSSGVGEVLKDDSAEARSELTLSPTAVFSLNEGSTAYCYWQVRKGDQDPTAHGLGRLDIMMGSMEAMQVNVTRLFDEFNRPARTPDYVVFDRATNSYFGFFIVNRNGENLLFIGWMDTKNLANTQNPFLFWDGSDNGVNAFRVPFRESVALISNVGMHASVAWNPFLNSYVLIYGGMATTDRGNKLFVRTADKPWGPFSKEYELHSFPKGTFISNPTQLGGLQQNNGQTIFLTMDASGSDGLPSMLQVDFNPKLEKLL